MIREADWGPMREMDFFRHCFLRLTLYRCNRKPAKSFPLNDLYLQICRRDKTKNKNKAEMENGFLAISTPFPICTICSLVFREVKMEQAR